MTRATSGLFLGLRAGLVVGALALSACDSPGDEPAGPDGPALVVDGRLPRLSGAGLAVTSAALEVAPDRVTHVAAVPHFHGEIIHQRLIDDLREAPVDSDGSFSLTLPRTSDWVLLLVDDNAPPEGRVVGYITVGQEEASLACLPTATLPAHLALGDLSVVGNEARSATLPEDTFTVDADTLLALARSDEGCKNMANAWRNFDPVTKVWWNAQVVFDLAQDLDDAGIGPPYRTFGWVFSVETNDPVFDVGAVCEGRSVVEIVPPAAVRVRAAGVEVVDPEHPLQSAAGPSQPGGCIGGDLNLSAEGDRIFMNAPLGHFLDVVEGIWTVRIDGVDVATFDLGVGNPVADDGTMTMVMPVMSIDNGDAGLERLDVTWQVWTGADFVTLPHDTLEPLLQASFLGLGALTDGFPALNGSILEIGAYSDVDVPGQRVFRSFTMPETPRVYLPAEAGRVGAGDTLLRDAHVGFDLGGVTVRVNWSPVCTGDDDADGWQDCVDCNDAHPALGPGPCADLPFPVITATLRLDGTGVDLAFDPGVVGVPLPGVLGCDEVLRDVATLGRDPVCTIDGDGRLVAVAFGVGATVEAGETLTIALDTPLQSPETHLPVAGLSVVIAAP